MMSGIMGFRSCHRIEESPQTDLGCVEAVSCEAAPRKQAKDSVRNRHGCQLEAPSA